MYLYYSPSKEITVKVPREFTTEEAVTISTDRISVRERLARAKEKVKEREETRDPTPEPPKKSHDDDIIL